MNQEHHHRLALPQGTRIQDFEFHRVLGQGGFGITYLGWNVALDIPVAIKEYLPADLATREHDLSVVPQSSQAASDFAWGLDRFLDEARILARFQHVNIVRVHHFFEAHRTAYIVMEYAEGETLSQVLKSRGTLDEAELKAILYPILDGLEVVHGADFLHRDIKPGNIIIRDEDNSPVLLDFGAARQAIGARSRSVTSIITPGYAPIEQYSTQGDQGPWTDIYALGAVCYRALTGKAPADATERVIRDPVIPVAERCGGQAGAGFLSAIDEALQMDKAARPQSVAAWRVALSGATPDTETDPRPVVKPEPEGPSESRQRATVDDPSVRQPKKRRGPVFAAVACVLALLLGGGYYYEYIHLPEERRRAQEAEIARQSAAEDEAKRQRDEIISELMTGAASDLASDRLTSPVGNNAWEKYQAVLELESGHKEAIAGLDSIVGRYVVKFGTALSRKNFEKAGEYVSRIRGVWADAPVLSGLEGRLSAAREAERRREEAERRRREAERARLAAEEAKRRQAEQRRQEQEAERAKLAAEEAEKRRRQEQRVGGKFRDCSECPEMVVVPLGSFTMGSPGGEGIGDERPRHRVRIDYRLAVGVYEVTFAEWDACVSAGGCGGYRPDDRGWGRGNRPVINVRWEDAQSYVRWLSNKTGKSYRLLSESEWEYVARAGSVTAYSWGNEIGHNRANCNGCGSRWDNEKTAPVGAFSANAWGLHDVHGNVWEWVADCWNDSYTGAPADGSAWESGDCSRRVLRGGSWVSGPRHLRAANRFRYTAGDRFVVYGFRIARTVTP